MIGERIFHRVLDKPLHRSLVRAEPKTAQQKENEQLARQLVDGGVLLLNKYFGNDADKRVYARHYLKLNAEMFVGRSTTLRVNTGFVDFCAQALQATGIRAVATISLDPTTIHHKHEELNDQLNKSWPVAGPLLPPAIFLTDVPRALDEDITKNHAYGTFFSDLRKLQTRDGYSLFTSPPPDSNPFV
ncbi:MAG TPA: hypothetical protein VLF68_04690 [Candidatus Saccharimonadales bacterium]|nr:hypothetical protein [Candidatus Saccharimonadales bacterium]